MTCRVCGTAGIVWLDLGKPPLANGLLWLDPEDGETHQSELVGSRCRVVIGYDTWQDKITDETKGRNLVRDVLRTKSAMAGQATGWTEVDPF